MDTNIPNSPNDTIIIINDICSICLIDIEENTATIKQVTCCKNKFHIKCYNDWIKKIQHVG